MRPLSASQGAPRRAGDVFSDLLSLVGRMSGDPPAGTTPQTETEKLPEMTRYVVGLLRRAPERPAISEEEAERIQEGHLAHLRRLKEAGNLIISGPFEEDTDLRGVLIFPTPSVDQARELEATDPAVAHSRLVVNFYTWYAPAGLRLGPPAPTDIDMDPDTG